MTLKTKRTHTQGRRLTHVPSSFPRARWVGETRVTVVFSQVETRVTVVNSQVKTRVAVVKSQVKTRVTVVISQNQTPCRWLLNLFNPPASPHAIKCKRGGRKKFLVPRDFLEFMEFPGGTQRRGCSVGWAVASSFSTPPTPPTAQSRL